MSPRDKKSFSSHGDTDAGETSVFHTPDGAPFVVCKSKEKFINPTTPVDATPESINQELNLDLGQKVITRKNLTLLWIINLLDQLTFRWWEHLFFNFWSEIVPLSFRRALTHMGWKIFFKLHKTILAKRSGLHPSQSYEYHAITTAMWGARFFAATPPRMRFALSQLYVIAPNPPPPADRVTPISELPGFLNDEMVPKEQEQACRVSGLYLHRQKKNESPSDKVIFWIYGGAYLAGDARGNSSPADWIGQRCGMDVFIPQVRLGPEASMDDALWDVCLAYRWLCSRMDDFSNQVFVLGISSGGALATRMMQLIAQNSRGESIGVPDYFSKLLDGMIMPVGGILFAPYVDYDREKKGSFLHYPRHDLVVTEAVQEYGLPYLEDFIPKHPGLENSRREYSPIHRSMEDLPPLCVHVSEHEAVYDMTIQLVNRARAEGVEATLYVFKYMCHVFSFLFGFIPEGRLSMELVSDWILEKAREDTSS